MSISNNIKTIVSNTSRLGYEDCAPFEHKVQMVLNHCVEASHQEIYCSISVDGNFPNTLKDSFAKVKNNIFVGFIDNTIDGSLRRGILFELMAVKDDRMALAHHVVILISGNPIVLADEPAEKQEQSPNENNDEDQLPSYTATLPRYDLGKVILDESTKNQIERAIALINNQHLIFESWGFREVDPNTKTILCFFGAPGTGKTMCAHALAKQLGKKILIASYASIESKWVGEGPKNMRKIFEDATNQDAILFFDEADSSS